jgi:hypothetical protein
LCYFPGGAYGSGVPIGMSGFFFTRPSLLRHRDAQAFFG